jgi:raffinose/stachyose/melibiose transport system substrate-binding protein
MRNTIRRTLVAVATAALIAPLAACAGAGGDSGVVEIDFFHRWPNEPKNAYFTELVEEFEAENPDIKVNVESVLNDAYKDKVKVVAGSSGAPDVMFSWSGTFVEDLVEAGNVMDLTDWLDENPDIRDRYYESQMAPFAVDGAQYGLPVGMHAKLFFYNEDIFAEQGLEVPATWDEFLDVLGELQDAGIAPLEYASKEPWTIAHYVGTLNQRVIDPEVVSADQDPATGEFTDPGYVEALEDFEELTGYMNGDPNSIGHEDARAEWAAGDAAIMYLQGSEVNYLTDVDFEYGTFNFPEVDGGAGDPSQLTGAPEGFVVSENTEHPEESLRFLEFMLNKENGIAYTEQTGELSAVVGAVEESDAPDILKSIAADIVGATAMTPWLDNAYDAQIVQAYLSETQLMLGGEKSAEEVMTAVQDAAALVRDAS